MLGQSEASRKAPLCWRRPPDRKTMQTKEQLPDLAIREGDWKLLCDYDGGRPQLFNLASDKSETTNVAASNLELVSRLAKMLRLWNDSMPADKGPELSDESKQTDTK